MAKKSQHRQIQNLKNDFNKARDEAMPFLLFFLAIVLGGLMSIWSTAVYDSLKERGGLWFSIGWWIITIGTPFILYVVFRMIQRTYIKPWDDIETKLNKLKND